MKYQEALSYLKELTSIGITPGLYRIRELCERLGNPQEAVPMVHIAGTNGKGSTLAFLSSILSNAGYRVGCYSSPAVVDPREVISVDKKPISKHFLSLGVEQLKARCEEMVAQGLPQPSAYEVETALAFWYFAFKKCDIVILETGMGGKEDATNLIKHPLAVILTSISRDHMTFLGESLREIATQKAGIIKSRTNVIVAKQPQEVMEVLMEEAKRKDAKVIPLCAEQIKKVSFRTSKTVFTYRERKDLEITLLGEWQPENASLAIEAVDCLREVGFSIHEAVMRRGLREAIWQGRFTILRRNPLLIVDGAHNVGAAKRLAKSLEIYFTNRKIIFIIGILRDKEAEQMLALMSGYAQHIITVTPPNNERARSAYDLACIAAKVHPSVTAVDSLEEAVEMSVLLAETQGVIVAFGSLSYLGTLMNIVEKGNRHLS
ncbi:MAG: bifunctional folylpolyglutamate synthase/dihydrofolate synthase [Lachnospiraceae bacterium]|jgi:dihydrofolate synthase/folylpolyglutamate synthase|nr:bifunctional folylpolyglutamate synthase/dihydrofolate synthase [Lachnospiraceae bacterium]